MSYEYPKSYDGHIFLDFSERKRLIMDHKKAKEAGDEDAMKRIEYALNDSEPDTDAELCAKGEYDTAIELLDRKSLLYGLCAQGNISFSDISYYEQSGKTAKELREELAVRDFRSRGF